MHNKKGLILFLAIICLSFITDKRERKAQLLLIGSYHMTNPGLDVVNLNSDDVLSEKRQTEMEILVKKLAKFKPTKIAVEITLGNKADTALQKNYAAYLEGNYTLRKHESEQIGFRLAKLMGHQKIYPINATGDFDMNKVMKFAMSSGMGKQAQALMQEMQSFAKQEEMALSQSTILEHFKHMNSTEFISKNWEVYQLFLTFNDGKTYAGADLFADNYRRNLKIVANILNMKESSDDRILVIYGAGHIPFFKSILNGYPEINIPDAQKYLK